MTPEGKLRALGLTLPTPPLPVANYVPFKRAGDILYISGQGPRHLDGRMESGKVGLDVSLEQAYEHARLTGLNLLTIAKSAVGELSRIEVVKVLGLVNATPDFADHPKVINGCSDLFVEILGDAGQHSRSAIGVGSLPANISVEIEAVMRIVNLP